MTAPDVSVLMVDPPWRYKVWSQQNSTGRTADRHYKTSSSLLMRDWDIPALMAKHSIMAMWVTNPLLQEAFELARYWGLTYNTVVFAWAKTNRSAVGRFSVVDWDANWFMGLGHSTRSNVELCLSFRKGKGVPKQRNDVRQLIVSPIGRHSQKPDEANRRLELLYPGPYCEVFARRQYPGWLCLGNEIDGRDICDVVQSYKTVEQEAV